MSRWSALNSNRMKDLIFRWSNIRGQRCHRGTLKSKINAGKIVYYPDRNQWRLDYKIWKYNGARGLSGGKTNGYPVDLKPENFKEDIRIKDVAHLRRDGKYIPEKKQEGTGGSYNIILWNNTAGPLLPFPYWFWWWWRCARNSRKIRGGNWFNIIAGWRWVHYIFSCCSSLLPFLPTADCIRWSGPEYSQHYFCNYCRVFSAIREQIVSHSYHKWHLAMQMWKKNNPQRLRRKWI